MQMKKINSDSEILKEYIQFKNETIVDVGCGTGELVRWMASKGITAIGIDIAEMTKKAKKFQKVKNEKFIVGTGEQLPINDNFADIVTYIASFHHIPSGKMMSALKECRRILKPKGRAILIEPIAKENSYYEIIKLAEDEAKIQSYAYETIKKSDEAGLKFVSEEIFYSERSFQDYINLLNIFVESENHRNEIIEQARKKTLKLCEISGENLDEFLYKSIARLIILEKNNEKKEKQI